MSLKAPSWRGAPDVRRRGSSPSRQVCKSFSDQTLLRSPAASKKAGQPCRGPGSAFPTSCWNETALVFEISVVNKLLLDGVVPSMEPLTLA